MKKTIMIGYRHSKLLFLLILIGLKSLQKEDYTWIIEDMFLDNPSSVFSILGPNFPLYVVPM